MNTTLYASAKAADDFFQKELERVYGRNAIDARYFYNHDDPGVLAAKAEKIRCDRLWAEEQEKNHAD